MAKHCRKRDSERKKIGIDSSSLPTPKPLAVAVALAMVPAVGLAEYHNNVEIYAIPTTESRTLVGVSGFMPFGQTNSSLFYGDLRYTRSSANINEFNLLLGRRYLGADNNWILGGYLAYDRRRSRTGRGYNQFGIGFEALSEGLDFRANYYHPTTGKKFLGYGGASYAGNNLVLHELYEEALRGIDAEVGFNPYLIDNMETRFYLGAYHYEGDVADDANGVRVRAELRPIKSVTVGLSFEDDTLFGSKGMLELRYSFGYPNERGRRTLNERMTEFARRDIDIRETSILPQGGAMSGPVNGLAALGFSDMIHIDNTNAAAGDGTAENPYQSITLCDAGGGPGGGCQDIDTLVYVHYGDGTSTGLDTGFTMPSGQTIIGEGYSFYGLGGNGLFPMVRVSSGGDTITLNDDTEVAGLDIYSGADNAIFGDGIQNFSIHHNRITAASGGIRVYGATGVFSISNNEIDAGETGITVQTSGAGSSLTGSISGNEVTDGGLYLTAYDNATQTVTVSNNRFSGEGSEGGLVNLYAFNYGGETTIQTVTLQNNVIAAEGVDGLQAWGGAANDATVIQTINASNNQITSEYDTPVSFDFISYDDGVATQNINLSGNTISGYYGGVNVYAGAEGGGIVTQNVTLSGNQITGEGSEGYGLFATNYASYGGLSTQNLTLENNTVTGGEGSAVLWQMAGAEGGDPSVAMQTFTASGNTFHVTDGSEGVAIYNLTGDYGSATQVVDMRDNILSSDGSEGGGLYLVNAPGSYWYSSDGSTGVQTVTLDNNQISGYGFFENIVGVEGGDAVGTQTIDIRDTSFKGIGIYNFAGEGGATATQTVDFSAGGNSAGGNGTYIENDYDVGGVATQTVDLRNNSEALSPVVCVGDDTQNIIGNCDAAP